jgi:hypothetical protein
MPEPLETKAQLKTVTTGVPLTAIAAAEEDVTVEKLRFTVPPVIAMPEPDVLLTVAMVELGRPRVR